MKFDIYCDGSCRNNGAKNAIGAWGYVILDSDYNILHQDCGVKQGTTNQQMELTAAIEGCEYIKKHLLSPFDCVMIHTDSAYLHNCKNAKWYESWQNNGWLNSKKQPVANKELWERLIPYFNCIEFSFYKVKGHSSDLSVNTKWNNYIDNIVQQASAEALK